MRFCYKFIAFLSAFMFFACGNPKPSAPFDTLEAYTKAIKKQDAATMKRLLSSGSLKMVEQEAKAQNRPLDDIVKDETLFSKTQTSLRYRNEKIDGERATIEVENSFGTWDTVAFVKEEGAWKIDKQSIANQMMRDIEQENNKEIDDIFKRGRIP